MIAGLGKIVEVADVDKIMLAQTGNMVAVVVVVVAVESDMMITDIERLDVAVENDRATVKRWGWASSVSEDLFTYNRKVEQL